METNRAAKKKIPKAYDAVQQGLVTPVKRQGSCGDKPFYDTGCLVFRTPHFITKISLSLGSCTAFATVSVIETCFKKKTGVLGELY